MSRLWYLNGDFDIELSQIRSTHLRSLVAEMTVWFVALGADSDRIILDVKPQAGYFDYLRWVGLIPAQPVQAGQQLPEHLGEPWGFCASAQTRLRTYGVKLDQPLLEVVKTVNSREFGYQLSHAALHRPQFLVTEASRLLQDRVGLSGALVVKQMHTNAGRNLIISESGVWSAKQREAISHLAQQGKSVYLEAWKKRLLDVSSRFELTKKGAVVNLSHHQTLVGSNGYFFGCLLQPDDGLAQYRQALDQSALVVSQALCQQGYFGPVGIDAFVYEDSPHQTRLATAVDINARHTMSTIAYHLWQRFGTDRFLLLRTVSAKKHKLPENIEDWHTLEGPKVWNPIEKIGVVLLTPLRVLRADRWVQPHRSLLCFVAQSKTQLQKQYTSILRRLGVRDDRLPG